MVGACSQLTITCSKVTRCEICLKLTIKTIERHHWRRIGVFILLTLNIIHTLLSIVSVVKFEHLNAALKSDSHLPKKVMKLFLQNTFGGCFSKARVDQVLASFLSFPWKPQFRRYILTSRHTTLCIYYVYCVSTMCLLILHLVTLENILHLVTTDDILLGGF